MIEDPRQPSILMSTQIGLGIQSYLAYVILCFATISYGVQWPGDHMDFSLLQGK